MRRRPCSLRGGTRRKSNHARGLAIATCQSPHDVSTRESPTWHLNFHTCHLRRLIEHHAHAHETCLAGGPMCAGGRVQPSSPCARCYNRHSRVPMHMHSRTWPCPRPHQWIGVSHTIGLCEVQRCACLLAVARGTTNTSRFRPTGASDD